MLRAVAPGSSGGGGSFSTLTVTGQGLFADGSAAAPSIAFTNEPATGFFRNGSNTIDYAAATTPRLRFFTSSGMGAVGFIGTGVFASISADANNLIGVQTSIAMRGGAGFGMKAIAGSYSVTQDDFTICCSTASQSQITVLLPAVPAMNQYLNIKKVSADANRLVIDGNGNLIDALSTQSTILTTRPSFALQFGSTVSSPTGSAWQIL